VHTCNPIRMLEITLTFFSEFCQITKNILAFTPYYDQIYQKKSEKTRILLVLDLVYGCADMYHTLTIHIFLSFLSYIHIYLVCSISHIHIYYTYYTQVYTRNIEERKRENNKRNQACHLDFTRKFGAKLEKNMKL
jgi:hypothetical protein